MLAASQISLMIDCFCSVIYLSKSTSNKYKQNVQNVNLISVVIRDV
jgi:hypothetical protein